MLWLSAIPFKDTSSVETPTVWWVVIVVLAAIYLVLYFLKRSGGVSWLSSAKLPKDSHISLLAKQESLSVYQVDLGNKAFYLVKNGHSLVQLDPNLSIDVNQKGDDVNEH